MALFATIRKWIATRLGLKPAPLLADPQNEFSYKRDFSYTPGKHIQQFVNNLKKPLEVYVEMYPDLYILQPNDELTIIYEQDPNWLGLGLHTTVHENSLQICLQEFDTATVLINGKPVEPWAHLKSDDAEPKNGSQA